MDRPKDATSDHRLNFAVLAISSGIAIGFFVARGAPADTDDEWESGAYGLSIASLVFLGVMIVLQWMAWVAERKFSNAPDSKYYAYRCLQVKVVASLVRTVLDLTRASMVTHYAFDDDETNTWSRVAMVIDLFFLVIGLVADVYMIRKFEVGMKRSQTKTSPKKERWAKKVVPIVLSTG